MPPWQTPQEADRWWKRDGVTLRYTALGKQPLTTARNLTNDVLAWQPDIVHGFKPKAYSGLVMWWLWQFHRRDLRLLVDMDDWEGPGGWNDLAPYSALEKRFFTWQEQWGMGHAHDLTVASRALQSIVWSNGVAVEKVHYLPNGSGLPFVEAGELDGASQARRDALALGKRPSLLVYSRLFEFDTTRLVAILAAVKDQVPDVAILFIGESLFEEDARRLRGELEQGDVLPAVFDLGWVDEADLPAALHLADVAIYLMDDTLINRCKCPVKLADLIAAGIPVAAEAVGQVPQYVINSKNGCLRDSGDVAGLAADITALLHDEQRRRMYGRAAQDLYRKSFSWDSLAHNLDSVYRQTQVV